MTAYRTITITCDECRKTIISDEFANIPLARRAAKQIYGMKDKVVKNGSHWDLCKKCADGYEEEL